MKKIKAYKDKHTFSQVAEFWLNEDQMCGGNYEFFLDKLRSLCGMCDEMLPKYINQKVECNCWFDLS